MRTAYESRVTDADYYNIGGYRAEDPENQKRDGWKARPDSEPFLIPDPIDWAADPFADPNWLSQFHGWRPMDPHLRAYLRTQDGSSVRYVVPWAVSWAAFRAQAPAERHKRLDALSGMRATRLALILDVYLRGDMELSGEEWAVLLALAEETATHLMTPEGIQPMNHGYFQALGLELLSRVLHKEPWADAGRERGTQAFNDLVSLQFTDEGVHVENSPAYHWYAVNQIHRSRAADRLASPRTVGIIERAEAAGPWLTFPDGKIADIGDSMGPGKAWTDPGENRFEVDGRPYAVAPFWRSGYGIVRSLPDTPPEEASMLLVVDTSHSHTHSHADKLSFELFEFGRRLIVDSGKYGYVRDPMRNYVESAVAHNTVGLEDHVIRRTDVTLDATRLHEPVLRDGAIVLSGEVVWETRHYAFTHLRELDYRPRESLVIRDHVSSDEPRRYASRLHFDRSLEVARDDEGLLVDLGEGRSMRVTSTTGDIALHRGETDPAKGWQSIEYMKAEPTWTAEVICPGTQREIEWRITFT